MGVKGEKEMLKSRKRALAARGNSSAKTAALKRKPAGKIPIDERRVIVPVRMPNPEGLEDTDLWQVYTDFILSRKAMMVAKTTLDWYDITAGRFIRWLVQNGKKEVADITAKEIRLYLSEFMERHAKESYVNGHARAIRTLTRFLEEENYIKERIKFKMPPTGEKVMLPHLSAEEVGKVLDACQDLRETALILLMVDTGLRRAEVISLNWDDLNIKTGVLMVKKGKGNKSRSVVVGIRTRRALLSYKRAISNTVAERSTGPTALDTIDNAPLIQTDDGLRFTINGFRSIILRISKRSGVEFSPHALRRTFATLSLKAGMSPLHLQGLLGHTTLEMTRRYTQMVDDDLVDAHQKHGPIDNFIR
jgi:site-specific recombinase XerD